MSLTKSQWLTSAQTEEDQDCLREPKEQLQVKKRIEASKTPADSWKMTQ